MPRALTLSLGLLASAFLAACASSSQSAADTVVVYEEASDLPESAKILIDVTPTMETRTGYGRVTSQLDLAKRAVRNVGGNAVLVIRDDSETTDARIRRSLDNGGTSSVSRVRYMAVFIPSPLDA